MPEAEYPFFRFASQLLVLPTEPVSVRSRPTPFQEAVMKIRQLVVFLLILALAGCSEEAPKPEKKTASSAPTQISAPLPAPTPEQTDPAAEAEQDAAPAAEQPAPQKEKKEEEAQVFPSDSKSMPTKNLFDPFAGIVQSAGIQGIAMGPNDKATELDPTYHQVIGGNVVIGSLNRSASVQGVQLIQPQKDSQPRQDSETYNEAKESGFLSPLTKPLSTFSIDVDTASYSNVRRFISEGQLPPAGAVRIEELINYFSYAYPQPSGGHPFSVTTELGPCPWNSSRKLVRIGLKAKDIDKKDMPPSNLVFLIDVSGSMSAPNKLPLLKQALKMLVRQLDEKDRVAMVVYAGSDAVVLETTPGSDQAKIFAAIESLGAGGSTHASSGIVTAYQLAAQSFIPGGNNRVILASDGDFNVGVTSPDELQKLVEDKRKSGVSLTVLGFGMGNYRDDTMEILADKGNGSYAYIDSLLEAKKVLVKELSGTLFTLAKDVKIQAEFNPAKVSAYRLIGYENRALADEDFNNDKKDAGEIGAGHTVTALYELIPADAPPLVDPLKYQQTEQKPLPAAAGVSKELMTVKLRYKPLDSDQSVLMDTVIEDSGAALENTSADFRFAAAVAGYGMLLTRSELAGDLTWRQVIQLAKDARGSDEQGWRAEFVRLAESAELLEK
jgi:Ca-activated chloride channel family protein